MNIFKRELIANRKSIIIWSIFLFIYIAMGMQKYDALVASGSDEFMKMMEALPKGLQAVFGLNTLDITSIIGYYGILYLYLILIVSIHAAMIGSNIINKEEKDKTAEFLMAKPVSRDYIVTYKLLASLVNIIILNLVSLISSLVILNVVNPNYEIIDILILHMGMFLTQGLFLIIGMGFALITRTPKKNGMMVMGILLSTFFLSMIIDIESRLEVLSFLTPFKYFDAKRVLLDGGLDLIYVTFVVLVMSVIMFFGYKVYKKRDLFI
jgi:ABC-2 type transport system permease protein